MSDVIHAGDMEPFEVRDPAFHEAVAPDARLTVVADGFSFTEGPVWHPHERHVTFSDIATSRQWRWSPADGLNLFRQPSNQANGNAYDPQGRLVTCEHASSKLVRVEHEGKLVRVLAAHFEGRRLNSPNDVIVDDRGTIFFTDPSFGRTRPDLGLIREQELPFQGVFRLDQEGLALVADDFEQPNGLCFTHDNARLLVNDTPRRTIRAFAPDGSGAGEVWARIEGDGSAVEGSADWNPDGMKADTRGRIWCNGPGGVHVLDARGRTLGVVNVPEKSTNFCFGGPVSGGVGLATLYITASTRLYALPTLAEGLPAF